MFLREGRNASLFFSFSKGDYSPLNDSKKIFGMFTIKEFISLCAEILVLIFCVVLFIKLCHVQEEQKAVDISPTPTVTVTPTATPEPTSMPTPSPSPTPEPTATPTPSPEPTPSPTPAPQPVSYGYAPGKPGYYKCEANGTHGFKIGTDYRVYAKGTAQRKLIDISRTDERTGIRIVTDPNGVDRYLVALGTAWCGGTPADIGRCVDIYMKNGATLYCVLGDVKKVEDTINQECRYGTNHNELIEFIIDTPALPKQTQVDSNYNRCGDEFVGEATSMRVYDYFIEGFGGK